MRVAERFIVALAVASYLAAAFLPCESPFPSFLGEAARADAHASQAPTGAGASEFEVAPSHHAGHAGHPASHAVPASAQASHHAHDARQAEPVTRQAKLELAPTCLCGCGETRAQVGGGTARLGSVLPGSSIVRFVEAMRVPIAAAAPARALEGDREIDPIPI